MIEMSIYLAWFGLVVRTYISDKILGSPLNPEQRKLLLD